MNTPLSWFALLVLVVSLFMAAPILLVFLLVLAWACFLSWLVVELGRPSDD